MKSVGGITSDPLAVSQIHSLTRSVIGDRPSHPIYKVPPPQGLLDEIRQFRMPKVRFHKAPESLCWGSNKDRVLDRIRRTLLRSG
jgi:hypothetical protein